MDLLVRKENDRKFDQKLKVHACIFSRTFLDLNSQYSQNPMKEPIFDKDSENPDNSDDDENSDISNIEEDSNEDNNTKETSNSEQIEVQSEINPTGAVNDCECIVILQMSIQQRSHSSVKLAAKVSI